MKIKKFSILLTILAFAFLSQPFTANAVVNWTKSESNPVLEKGDPGAWDEGALEGPMVIKDGETYKMWYDGEDSDTTPYCQIGYATSSDGTSWTKDENNPVLPPSGSGWDSKHVGLPCVIKMTSGTSPYRMWYAGSNLDDPDGYAEIGYATSDDGIDWVKGHSGNTNPVLTKGGTNDWDATGVIDPTVIYEESATTPYKMWYVGWNYTDETMGIGYAESDDGITWVKHANNPVINPGPAGSWKDNELYSPTVIKEGSIYRMWYDAEPENSACTIGYAYSIDGINWREYDGNPVIMQGDTATDDFDEHGALSPMVLKDGNTYKMWYIGEKDCDPDPCFSAIGYATAPAYQGTHLAIGKAMVKTRNSPQGMLLLMGGMLEGAGPLDINELKVTLPDSSVFQFNDNNMLNVMGMQYFASGFPMDPLPGTYTFSVEANNGLTDSNSLTLSVSTFADYLYDGSENLDRHIKVGETTYSNPQEYISTTTPTFRWKPYVGDTYYYRVSVYDWTNKAYWWYMEDPILGGNMDGNGYLSVTVPDGILKPNTPYHWEVEVLDTDNPFSAYNSAISTKYHFYTGTKDESAEPDFLMFAELVSQRSFRSGDSAQFWAGVWNLAPWDIDTTTNKFSVKDENETTFYEFWPDNNAITSDPHPFMYIAGLPGIPQDTIGDGYEFYVSDLSGYSESMYVTFSDVINLPRVSREEMTPSDNAYLSGTQPILTWKSKGTGYKYRARIFDWNYRRFTFSTDYIDGVAEGQNMSVQIPEGTLKPNNPYRWWVEVYDGTNQTSRTRSQWLSFMTGGEEESYVGSEFPIATTPTQGITIPAATITVDGDPGDWSGIDALVTDPQGDDSASYTGDDIKALYVAKDADNLYIRMDLWENANTSFGNGSSPNEGRYGFFIDNNGTHSYLELGIAYNDFDTQWELGYNGSNPEDKAPPELQGPQFVGVSGSVIELEVPLSLIGNPTTFYDIRGEVNNCCVPDYGTLDETASVASTIGSEFGLSAAFDGTNYLVGIQGDEVAHYNITAQMISETGSLVGPRISIGRTGGLPLVAFDGTNYLMVWSDDANEPNKDIYGQFINTSGDLVGSPFPISQTAGRHELGFTGIAFDGTNYLVIWTDGRSSIDDQGPWYVYGQIVSKEGSLVGGEIQISTDSGHFPGIAFDGTNYLVVWVEDTNDTDYYGQFISTSGTPVGENFLIESNSYPSDNPSFILFDGTRYVVNVQDHISQDAMGHYVRFVDKNGNVSPTRVTLYEGQTFTGCNVQAFDGTNYLATLSEGWGGPPVTAKGRFYDNNFNPVGNWFTIFDTQDYRVPIGPSVLSGGSKYLAVTTRVMGVVEYELIGGDVYGVFITTEPAGDGADEEQIRTNFQAAVNAYNNKDIDTLMSYFSPDYLDDGIDYDAQQQNFGEEFLDPNFEQVSYTINNIIISGSYATVSVTWDDGETEEMFWIKEGDGVWRLYGNQQKYGVEARSQNWSYGEQYMVHFEVEDPNHEATSVEITGPGITESLSLDYDTNENGWNSWATGKSLDFGNNPPAPPLIYTFTIVDSSGTTIIMTYTVESFVSVYATDLSPSGGETITDPLVFSWTGVGSGYTYSVELNDEYLNRIWNAYDLTTTSVSYDGSALTSGAGYIYWVVVEDEYGNSSFAEESFVYQAASVSGNIFCDDFEPGLGDLKVFAFDGPDPTVANLLDIQVIGSANVNGTSVPYVLSNLAVNGYVYLFARWDKDGDGVPSTADYRGSYSGNPLLIQAGGHTGINITILPPAIEKGDINGDGNVDLADAILALQVLVGLDPGGINLGADVNGDGKIGLAEVIYIMQTVAGLRPSTESEISMITPYVDGTDISSIESFDNVTHRGIDLIPIRDWVPFQAVSDGVVEYIKLVKLGELPTSNWQVEVEIRYNSTYSVLYAFEPMTPVQGDGQAQQDNILNYISVGQPVSQGDVIGDLYKKGEGAHVHFGLFKYGSGGDPTICPEPYFTPGARDSILSLIPGYPAVNMCN